ncbi:hypothetical protein FF100_04905 [Methylobacterium terricola]|uniref:Secreted protein n=1 Tax=Methylobacterium terricola TaxID=2583531 RepID=A0A5C4LK92_9HYPH|nr:hypothetical protein [Methylobacterium terricola]TNC14917.1 hypothetical protein FF100_04905 [Methylobacterium terricola]
MTKTVHSTRRSMFVGAAALAAVPLATPAMALPSPDAALIRDAERAISLKHEINAKAVAENWDDDTVAARCEELNALFDAVSEMPAFSRAGLEAKAKLLAVDTARSEPATDQVEILLASLLRDLIGAAAQVPA